MNCNDCDMEFESIRAYDHHECVSPDQLRARLAALEAENWKLRELVREGAGLHQETCHEPSSECDFVLRARAALPSPTPSSTQPAVKEEAQP